MEKNNINEMTTPENLAKYNFTDEQKEQIASAIRLNGYLDLLQSKVTAVIERKKNENK